MTRKTVIRNLSRTTGDDDVKRDPAEDRDMPDDVFRRAKARVFEECADDFKALADFDAGRITKL